MTPDPDLSRLLSDRIVLACRAHQRTAHALARLLVELVEGGHLRALGYATLAEYAETALDLEPRVARDLLRIGRKLDELPLIDAAMAEGRLGWTKARELVRVATVETEAAWIAYASLRTSRALERLVTHVGRGEPPPTEGAVSGVTEPTPVRRRVAFEMESTDATALFRALALLRVRAGLDAAEAEDGALLAALAQATWRWIGTPPVRRRGGGGGGRVSRPAWGRVRLPHKQKASVIASARGQSDDRGRARVLSRLPGHARADPRGPRRRFGYHRRRGRV